MRSVIILFLIVQTCLLGIASVISHADDRDEVLIVAESKGNKKNIYEISLKTEAVRSLLPQDVARQASPLAVAADEENKALYWTDSLHVSISRLYPNNSNQSNALNVVDYSVIYSEASKDDGLLECLVLDQQTQILYYCRLGMIGRIYTNGTTMEPLISEAKLKPRAIVLDKANKRLYFSDVGENPGIFLISLTDSNQRVAIISTDIQWPNGLGIDFIVGFIYWADGDLERIERCRLDGSKREILVNGSNAHYFGLTLDDDNLYYTDWNHPFVMKMTKTGRNIKNFQRPMLSMASGIIHASFRLEEIHQLSIGMTRVTMAPVISGSSSSKFSSSTSNMPATPLGSSLPGLSGAMISIIVLVSALLVVAAIIAFIVIKKCGRCKSAVKQVYEEMNAHCNQYDYINPSVEQNSRNEQLMHSYSQNCEHLDARSVKFTPNDGVYYKKPRVFNDQSNKVSPIDDNYYLQPRMTENLEDGYLKPMTEENEYYQVHDDETKEFDDTYASIP